VKPNTSQSVSLRADSVSRKQIGTVASSTRGYVLRADSSSFQTPVHNSRCALSKRFRRMFEILSKTLCNAIETRRYRLVNRTFTIIKSTVSLITKFLCTRRQRPKRFWYEIKTPFHRRNLYVIARRSERLLRCFDRVSPVLPGSLPKRDSIQRENCKKIKPL